MNGADEVYAGYVVEISDDEISYKLNARGKQMHVSYPCNECAVLRLDKSTALGDLDVTDFRKTMQTISRKATVFFGGSYVFHFKNPDDLILHCLKYS
jgi:hypothetical protein